MATLTAKYTTLKTLLRNGFDDAEFAESMAQYGYTTRLNYELEVIEIVDDEGEVVDTAHPVYVKHNGVWYYEIYHSVMETNWSLGLDIFSTMFDEIEVDGFPYAHRRAMAAAQKNR